jgi:hypothetical protein
MTRTAVLLLNNCTPDTTCTNEEVSTEDKLNFWPGVAFCEGKTANKKVAMPLD